MRLRKRVAFSASSPGSPSRSQKSWVLKGAFALSLRLGVRTRATKDIDLAGADDEQTGPRDSSPRRPIDLHDHFNFDVARTAALDKQKAFRAVATAWTAEVAGRRFEQFP